MAAAGAWARPVLPPLRETEADMFAPRSPCPCPPWTHRPLAEGSQVALTRPLVAEAVQLTRSAAPPAPLGRPQNKGAWFLSPHAPHALRLPSLTGPTYACPSAQTSTGTPATRRRPRTRPRAPGPRRSARSRRPRRTRSPSRCAYTRPFTLAWIVCAGSPLTLRSPCARPSGFEPAVRLTDEERELQRLAKEREKAEKAERKACVPPLLFICARRRSRAS